MIVIFTVAVVCVRLEKKLTLYISTMERCKEDVPDIESINNRSLELFTTIDNFKHSK
jgi:hypothetical protein